MKPLAQMTEDELHAYMQERGLDTHGLYSPRRDKYDREEMIRRIQEADGIEREKRTTTAAEESAKGAGGSRNAAWIAAVAALGGAVAALLAWLAPSGG